MAKKHFLTFATNFKNENPYLKDWIEYHVKVGVDHFYLYDQDGSEEAKEILRPYEENGIVTRHPWTHLDGTKYDGATKWWQRNKNHMGFAHAAKTYRKEFQWLMKITGCFNGYIGFAIKLNQTADTALGIVQRYIRYGTRKVCVRRLLQVVWTFA